ncbi:putative RNA polymerase II nuclear localization protein SLC7A6OS [Tautogolabrus adspersus]
MDPNTTILRVKRKRGIDPADALLLACKRIRPEPSQNSGETVPEPNEAEIENSVFKLVATVATQDAPVQTQVRQALARPRMAHPLRPSAASKQRIVGDLRSTKWSTRREERYRILSNLRTGVSSPAEQQTPQTDAPEGAEETGKEHQKCLGLGEIQVVDLVHEDVEEQKPSSKMLSSDPEVILCNNTKMLRERLSISGERLGEDQQEQEADYVYDLYYQETVTPGWIQDILSVRAYADEGELVPDVVHEEEVYEDEDDENEEANWRNDYPDEGSDADSDREERYGGYWEEEHSYSRRSWESYQREVLHELGCQGEDEDDDGDKYDSD